MIYVHWIDMRDQTRQATDGWVTHGNKSKTRSRPLHGPWWPRSGAQVQRLSFAVARPSPLERHQMTMCGPSDVQASIGPLTLCLTRWPPPCRPIEATSTRGGAAADALVADPLRTCSSRSQCRPGSPVSRINDL
jgi:hypothetical protein